jgi:hypothetical protein
VKKDKQFDCVRMKWEIQQEMQREFADVAEAEAREIQRRRVAEDPILGRVYARLTGEKESAGRG